MNLSQEDFAKKLNTTKQVISRYENGQRSPKISVAIQIASTLGIPLEMLIDDNVELSLDVILTEHEKKLITAYRNNTNMQDAVDRLLGIDDSVIADDIVKTINNAKKVQPLIKKEQK